MSDKTELTYDGPERRLSAALDRRNSSNVDIAAAVPAQAEPSGQADRSLTAETPAKSERRIKSDRRAGGTDRRGPSDRRTASDRRSQIDRRSGLDRRGLDVGRGPGRRLSDVRKAAEEGSYTGELREFILAVDEYKKANNCPFPSYSQIFEVVKYLGYRKVADIADHINEVQSDDATPDQPSDQG